MKILNIQNLSTGDFSAILDFCTKKLISGEGAFLIPMNPIKVVKARKKPEFQRIINNADWVFADSVGMRLAASILHNETIAITPGYQVMFQLLKLAEDMGKSVFFLGTTNEILGLAMQKLTEIHPRLKIAGKYNGFFTAADENAVFSDIAAKKPDFVFVAMGEYKQEVIIEKLRKIHWAAIFMGVGGSIDLIAGKQPKPPKWIQKNHLEWLYRFFRQPFRIPRFKALPIFMFLILKEKLGK